MDYKVPGVYIEEVALFPPSVTAVATGIPAFVGHTQLVVDANGNSLINKPIRLISFLEFTTLFGSLYNPDTYRVRVDPAADFTILDVTPVNGNVVTGNRYYLFDAMRHYFDNGGGPCYVVTVGDYDDDVIYGTDTTGLRGGLRALEKVDEPAILAVPDSVALDFVGAGDLHKDIIEQCKALQDRFGILDMVAGYRVQDSLNPAQDPVKQFRDHVGAGNLNYAAVYYPWLCTTYLKEVSFGQLNIVDNVLVPVPDATIDIMTGDTVLDGLVTNLRNSLSEEGRVLSKITAPVLNRSNYTVLSTQFSILKSAVLAATTDAAARLAFSALMGFVRQLALSFRDLENDSGNSEALTAKLTLLEADVQLQAQLMALISFEKNAGVMNSISAARGVPNVEADYLSLDSEGWIGAVTVASIPVNGTDFTDSGANTILQTAQDAANDLALVTAFDSIVQTFISIAGDAIFRSMQAEKKLFAQHPFFKKVYERVRKDMSLLPPSGAVAGVYAATDRTRGVWKAPANVSLRSVVAPAVKITDQDQGSLNVHDSGKSINALRAFTGKGNLIWGARTLAGNDNDWRYINVRRFFTFVEESAKKASEPFVFESNDVNTWIRIRAMLENFLTIQWRQGALAGSTAKQAFFVKVGLNETMDTQDILEGRLIVEIGMAVVRPAEFIILRFSHKMQES